MIALASPANERLYFRARSKPIGAESPSRGGAVEQRRHPLAVAVTCAGRSRACVYSCSWDHCYSTLFGCIVLASATNRFGAVMGILFSDGG
jgi:hypothetical protein